MTVFIVRRRWWLNRGVFATRELAEIHIAGEIRESQDLGGEPLDARGDFDIEERQVVWARE